MTTVGDLLRELMNHSATEIVVLVIEDGDGNQMVCSGDITVTHDSDHSDEVILQGEDDA